MYERCYWRDIELLVADMKAEWDYRISELLRSGDPLAMKHTEVPSTHRGTLTGDGKFAPSSDVQMFTPAVCTQSLPVTQLGRDYEGLWVKPPGITNIDVYAVGPGSGGGSGRKGAAATVRCGGGGGATGNVTMMDILASDLPDEVPVCVACGSAGAVAITANSTNGNTATSPNDTVFGTFVGGNYAAATFFPLCMACGAASGGGGGTATAGSGGGKASQGYTFQGVNGGAASATGGAGSTGAVGNGTAGGGGGGGGVSSAEVVGNGGGSGAASMYNGAGIGVSSGGAAHTAGTTLANGLFAAYLGLSNTLKVPLGTPLPSWGFFAPGGGGGGGGGVISNALPGGDGANGFWGGGGGGGGAGTDTSSPGSGNGGGGGDGFLMVVSW